MLSLCDLTCTLAVAACILLPCARRTRPLPPNPLYQETDQSIGMPSIVRSPIYGRNLEALTAEVLDTRSSSARTAAPSCVLASPWPPRRQQCYDMLPSRCLLCSTMSTVRMSLRLGVAQMACQGFLARSQLPHAFRCFALAPFVMPLDVGSLLLLFTPLVAPCREPARRWSSN